MMGGWTIGKYFTRLIAKYRYRIRMNLTTCVGIGGGYLLLAVHYFAGITFLPILPMLFLSIFLWIAMVEWRDQSVAYERFLVVVTYYLKIKGKRWEQT